MILSARQAIKWMPPCANRAWDGTVGEFSLHRSLGAVSSTHWQSAHLSSSGRERRVNTFTLQTLPKTYTNHGMEPAAETHRITQLYVRRVDAEVQRVEEQSRVVRAQSLYHSTDI